MLTATVTVSDILRLKEDGEMGRNFYSKPKVHKTDAKAARWYFRPSAPVLVSGEWQATQLPRVYLGLCSEVSAREAKRKRDEYCKTLNRTPAMVKSQVLFKDFLAAYRETYIPTLEPETQRSYGRRLKNHIEPNFGDLRICDIGKEPVQSWINSIEGTRGSKIVLLSTLSSAFEVAADWGYTNDRNPCRRVRVRGTVPDRDLSVPEPLELVEFIETTYDPYRVAILVGLFCGLRPGEIRGLVTRSVRSPKLWIYWKRDRETNELLEPKRRSKRWVPLPEFLADELAPFCEGKGEDTLLFPDMSYAAMHQHFNVRAKRSGIWKTGFSWHALRHCYATYRDEYGAEGLQQAMGHKSPTTTKGYITPALGRQVREVEEMAKAFKVVEMPKRRAG